MDGRTICGLGGAPFLGVAGRIRAQQRRCQVALAAAICSVATPAIAEPPTLTSPATWTLQAHRVATGLHGAQGIRQVGRFHSGGPFTTNPEFLLQMQTGRVLDPDRVLVAIESNLGARPGNAAQAVGTILSIDPRASDHGPLAVPADLALRAQSPGAPLQIYSAQSDRYMNGRHNGNARTAAFAAVSGPRYLSINNAFGRPWVANAPFGLRGDGSESVIDPDGAPLANAPSDDAGGVFVGGSTPRTSAPKAVRSGWFASLWNRRDSGQLTPGAIEAGALGTAFLGPSPDGSGFAVFAVVTGTGAVVQAHVQDGVDGLAPAGTIDVGSGDPGVIGVAFKWNPRRALFVADARRDRITVLQLGNDAQHFTVEQTSHIASPWLHRPVDLAAAMPEIANPRFASHTTLAGDSDLYIVNRGDGSLLRMRQDGSVVARAVIEVPGEGPLGPNRLRSIAVSADAQRLWVIAQHLGSDESALLELRAFDAAGVFADPLRGEAALSIAATASAAADGARLFSTEFTPRTGLGPLFNAQSCVTCHPGPGGASVSEAHFVRRIARMEPLTGRVSALDGSLGSLAPRRSTREMGEPTSPPALMPRDANVVSLRMPLALFASGRIDEIPDAVIAAQAVAKGDGIKGKVQYVTGADGTRRVGRYGWKADVATLEEMVAQAMENEMGITSAVSAHPGAPVKDDGSMVRSIAAFLRQLAVLKRDSPPVSMDAMQARQ